MDYEIVTRLGPRDGRGIARMGAKVAVHGTHADSPMTFDEGGSMEELADEITETCGSPTMAVWGDVTRETDIKENAKMIRQAWGQIDILIACAGRRPRKVRLAFSHGPDVGIRLLSVKWDGFRPGLQEDWQPKYGSPRRGDDELYRIHPICAFVALQLQAGLDGFLAIEKYVFHQRGIFPHGPAPPAIQLVTGSRNARRGRSVIASARSRAEQLAIKS